MGDLARDTKGDENFPSSSDDESIMRYLKTVTIGNQEAYNTVISVINEYALQEK